MLIVIPKIEALSMEHVIFEISIVVFVVLEYLKSKTISSSVLELTIVNISVDPDPRDSDSFSY